MMALADFGPLERLVEHALASGDETALHVLGYGEITSVLAWPRWLTVAKSWSRAPSET